MSEHWTVLHATFQHNESDERGLELQAEIKPVPRVFPEMTEGAKTLTLRLGSNEVVLEDSELAEFLIWTRANL